MMMSSTTDEQKRKLEELGRRCTRGEVTGVELELSGWCGEEDCPAAARVLLASLLARRGRYEHARAVMCAVDARNLAAIDALELQTIISVLMAMDYKDAARRLSRLLLEGHGQRAEVRRWLVAMSVPGDQEMPAEPEYAVEELAKALADDPQVAVSLVYAEKLQPQQRSVGLLRRAMGRVVEKYRDSQRFSGLCLAMAELAMLASDWDDARQWAHEGLKADPYSAGLALVLAQVGDDLSVGPAAASVLSAVAQKYPDYRDVRAALIRREQRDGKASSARRRLAAWLSHEPGSVLALQLREELAA
jgi:hypothetical protein